jgi:hypothetical protein
MKKAPKFTARFLKAYEAANRVNANWETAQARLGHLTDAGSKAALQSVKEVHISAAAAASAIGLRIWPEMNEAFTEANGTARSFTLSAHDAWHRVREAERDLETRGVPQRDREGCEVWEASGGPTASAYKYSAPGTRFGFRRDASGGWELIRVERIYVAPKQRGRFWLKLTVAARDAMIRHALEGTETISAGDLARLSDAERLNALVSISA